ncbi:NADH-quinone oxidoreductase subunit L [Haloarchaeobius sp. HRN-SO-5]|uniref:NADH-quinone oxidoreductase subunit L n=1 Tax=Haloarchaeobius sp. HRN-SO-5 TaxID=3446118 RepID=UPI003EBEDA5E
MAGELAFELAPAIVALPFASFLVALALGNYMPKKGALGGILATGASLVLSLFAMVTVFGGSAYQADLFTWSAAEEVPLHFGILIDPLSALMLVIVSLIAFLVHVFSLGYMNDEGETGLPRYYSELGLFTFSMLAFVMADNLLMAFMFFELVGLCSYLLIGFWFRQDGPPSAAKKAFLVTRFGDYFFLIGVVGIVATFGTSRFVGVEGQESFPVLAEQALQGSAGELNTFLGMGPEAWFPVLGLLVLGGVIGKSAQFPLHTWLPDAMEGPTPVSALIHAATMVAAGVYLVARMYGFYALLPTVLALIALTGGFTALFAATMGVVKREIKQVLAYSTISQYGYMMLALGGGGYVAATFHLMTHAFFKALLFLGAGSVIIAMHHNEDMWDMGGLKDKMPVTYATFLAGSLALAGIFPFAGFWSKDEALFITLEHAANTAGIQGTLMLVAYGMGMLAVLFTGFYTFRMVFLTFHGEPRTDTARDPHGVRWNVKAPLVVLGVLATVAGFVNAVPLGIEELHHYLDAGENAAEPFHALTAHHYTGEEGLIFADYGAQFGHGSAPIPAIVAAGISLVVALLGVGAAVALYRGPSPTEHTDRLGPVKTLWYNNYYQDEYQVWLATGLTYPLAKAANKFDMGVIDGVVNGVSRSSITGGSYVKRIQTGVVTNYAALLALGLVALLLIVGFTGGWFA